MMASPYTQRQLQLQTTHYGPCGARSSPGWRDSTPAAALGAAASSVAQVEANQREDELQKKIYLSRIKKAFTMVDKLGGPDGDAMNKELVSAAQAYGRCTREWCQTCGPNGNGSFTPSRCTGCAAVMLRASKQPAPPRSYGSTGRDPRTGKKIQAKRKQCEDCGQKQAIFGLPSDGVKRWCSGCGKPRGAYNMVRKLCEDCGLVTASHILEGEGRLRWCSGCSARHGGVTYSGKQVCQKCRVSKDVRYKMPGDHARRWCPPCASDIEGAVDGKGNLHPSADGSLKCQHCGKNCRGPRMLAVHEATCLRKQQEAQAKQAARLAKIAAKEQELQVRRERCAAAAAAKAAKAGKKRKAASGAAAKKAKKAKQQAAAAAAQATAATQEEDE